MDQFEEIRSLREMIQNYEQKNIEQDQTIEEIKTSNDKLSKQLEQKEKQKEDYKKEIQQQFKQQLQYQKEDYEYRLKNKEKQYSDLVQECEILQNNLETKNRKHEELLSEKHEYIQ